MRCTVIIPTYGRPQHLKRILSYYHQYGGGLSVVIADSSIEEVKKLNKEIALSFKNTSFQYLDKYDQSINPIAKIFDALNQVDTEYCTICADDDFITPLGIEEAIHFLDLNPDFTTVCGDYVMFVVKGVPCYRLYRSQTNAHAEPQQRLYSVAVNNSGNFYAVRRTGFMKILFTEAYKITAGLSISGPFRANSSAFFVEYIVTWLSVIYGKTKCLDMLFCVREEDTPAKFKRIGTSLPEIMKETGYKDKEREFLDCISNHLSHKSGIDIVESHKIVNECISVTKRHHLTLTIKVSRMIVALGLPDWLDQGIREAYRAIASNISYSTYHTYPNISQYRNSLEQVNSCIVSNAKEIYR